MKIFFIKKYDIRLVSSLELVVICLYCSYCFISANFITAVVFLFIDYLVNYSFCDDSKEL